MKHSIEIANLTKEYKLGVIGHGTLYRDLQSLWARIKGKEDPNSLISSQNSNNIKKNLLALSEINLNISEGEVVGIIGPNGAGKSTLLKILSRITSPSFGLIKIKGRIGSLLEVGTGFHPELTGRENIYLSGTINGMTKREIDLKIDDIVDFAGVSKFIDTPVKRYSTGMQIRLGFSVSTHLDPDILIVDEVLAVGDASFVKKALSKMKSISKQKGRTVLFVSHNMESIQNLCSRVLLMQEGKIIMDDTPSKVVNFYLDSSKHKEVIPCVSFKRDKIKKYQLLKFGIINHENKESAYLDRTKDFKIYFEYYIDEDIDDLGVCFAINTNKANSGVNNNTTVIQWSDIHHGRYINDKNYIIKKKGKYRSVVNFPKYILNDGSYSLTVYLGNNFVNYEIIKEKLIFELIDYDSCYIQENGHRCSGLLAMPLDWNTDQII